MKSLYSLLFLFLLCCEGQGQPLQRIAHCPSNEVYDMLIDKKGFIWIAHNFGISRYDGISFTNFSNPVQSSLSVSDLIEDNYGRIWCHNFNGQIFYIKDDKMVYLKEFNFKIGNSLPRMVLLGEELFVTSTQYGLFVCNTATLKCRYLAISNNDSLYSQGITSICALKNTLLAYGANSWYTYTRKEGLHLLKNVKPLFINNGSERAALQPHPFRDTAIVFNNAEGVLYGVTITNNKLVRVYKRRAKAAINTISVLDNNVWVNTKAGSYTIGGQDSLYGYNITSMLYDKQGNKWFGSLTDGLLTVHKDFNWKPFKIKGLENGDAVRLIEKTGKWFALSTRNSKIITTTSPLTANNTHIFDVPIKNGTIENIQVADKFNFFIETSSSLYLLNAYANKLVADSTGIGNVKDIALHNSMAFAALSTAVQIINAKAWKLQIANKAGVPFAVKDSLQYISSKRIFLKKRMRCRAVMFDTLTNSLLISFSDGLQRLKSNKLSYIIFNGQPIFVSSMARYGNKIYAGTFNNGLFMIDGYSIKRIESSVESIFDGIVRIKLCNKHLWVFSAHSVKMLDAETHVFVNNIYPVPADVSEITDADEDSTNIYLATNKGLFTISLKANTETNKANPTLLYVLVNNTDTIFQTDISLAADKNNVLFRLAIPVYKNAEQLHFKYRLVSGNDTASSIWYYTHDAQRDIQFNALKPGSYTIEILAVNDNRIISNSPLVYSFTIEKPWYNTWWFYVVVLLFTVSASVALYQYRLYQLVKMERMRRKISNDLHDDIGSTLSSINVYSQLAKSDRENIGYIDNIQSNTVSIINNLDDLVWNINPKNDTLGELVNRMELFALPLLFEKGIERIFAIRLSNRHVIIPPNIRANMYLLFKEAVNNVIKHSGCTQCRMYFIQKGNKVRLIVNDNGKGFNIKTTSQHRNGMHIMAERVKDLKGRLTINSLPGVGTEIKVDCKL